MGIFPHVVESTARHINALLNLQKVHPQVRADVKRFLDELIEKSYQEVFDLPQYQQESATQICRSLANDIVNTCLTVHIPRSELFCSEKKCAELEERLRKVVDVIKYHESSQTELKIFLADVQNSHRSMLHTYFREVLILRRRIDHLKKRLRKEEATRLSLAISDFSSSSEPNAKRLAKKGQRFPAKKSKSICDLTSANAKIIQEVEKDFSTTVDGLNAPPPMQCTSTSATNISIDDTVSFRKLHSDTVEEKEVRQTEASQNDSNSLSSTYRGDHGFSPLVKKSKVQLFDAEGGQCSIYSLSNTQSPSSLSKISNLEQLLHYISRSEEPVDAIFDYEEYLGLLKESNDFFEARVKKIVDEKKMESQNWKMQSCFGFSASSTSLSPQAFRLSQTKLKRKESDLLTSHLKHSGIGVVIDQLFDNLENMRREMQRLESQYSHDMCLMSEIFSLQQSRSDALANCFASFMYDISGVLQAIQKSLKSKHCCDLFKVSTQEPLSLERLLHARSEQKFAMKVRELLAEDEEHVDVNCSLAEGIYFWKNKPIIEQAESLLKAFGKGHTKLRRRLKDLLLENEYLSTTKADAKPKYTRSVSSSRPEVELSSEAKFELWKKSHVEGTAGLTGQHVLSELVKLRLRRVCNRARLHCFESLLETEKDECKIKRYKAICFGLKHQIAKDGERIKTLLRLLYFSLNKFGIGSSFTIFSPPESDQAPSITRRPHARKTLYSLVGTSMETDNDGNCVYFNDQCIPLTFFDNRNDLQKTYTKAEVSTRHGGDYQYYTGVHLGRPVKEGMWPFYQLRDGVADPFRMLHKRDAGTSFDSGIVGGAFDDDNPDVGPEAMPMTRILYPRPLNAEEAEAYLHAAGRAASSSTRNADSPSVLNPSLQDRNGLLNSHPRAEQPPQSTGWLVQKGAHQQVGQKGPYRGAEGHLSDGRSDEESRHRPGGLALPAPLSTSYQDYVASSATKANPNAFSNSRFYNSPYFYDFPTAPRQSSAEDDTFRSPHREEHSVENSSQTRNELSNVKDSQREPNRSPSCGISLRLVDNNLPLEECRPVLRSLRVEPCLETTEAPVLVAILKAKRLREVRVEREAALKQHLHEQQPQEQLVCVEEKAPTIAGTEVNLRLGKSKLPPLLPKPQQAAQLQRDQTLSILHSKK